MPLAALEAAAGKVVAACPKPDTAIHADLDNRNAHAPKINRRLKRRLDVRFHFDSSPRVALKGKSLRGASFFSADQLREHTDAFIKSYNEHTAPVEWTKAKFFQRRLKDRRISQL